VRIIPHFAAKSAASYHETTILFASGKPMDDTSRAILVSWAAAKITFVMTIVMACAWLAYTWNLRGGGADWFDTLAWGVIFGGLMLVPLLFVPALIVAIIVGIFCKMRLSRKRRIRLSSDQT